MFGLLKTQFFITGIALGLCLCASYAGAQVLSQSAADFAREHGGGDLVEALENKTQPKIICGSKENLCDQETEYCLKAVYETQQESSGEYSSHVITTKKEYGKCISKSKVDADNLYQYFQKEGCYEKGKWGSIKILPCSVTIQNVSWLTANSAGINYSVDVVFDDHTFTDPATNKKYRLAVGGTPTIEYAEKTMNGCEVLPVKVYNMQGCFFCPLASLIFGTANEVTSKSFKFFASSFRVVLLTAFAIWVALLALKQLFAMTKQDAPKFLAAILKQGFKVAIAFFLLTYSTNLFSGFVIPVLKGGLTMGTHIQSIDLPEPDYDKYHYSNPTISNTYYNYHKGGEKSLYERIELFLAYVQSQLSYLQAIGTTIFCVGSHKMWELDVRLQGFKDGVRMMFLGALLTVFAFLLTFSFAFYFLDALLQLAILGAMMPFMIAGWPLKATAQYATTGFKMLLNTFFVMFFTGFVISVNIEMINQALSLSNTQIGEKINSSAAIGNSAYEEEIKNMQSYDGTKSGFDLIVDALNNQEVDKLVNATNIGGTGFLLLAFACIFGFKFIAQASPLANKLASGGFGKGGISAKIGTMAASTVKGVANKVAEPTGKAIAAEYHRAGGVTGIVGKAGSAAGDLAKGAGQAVQSAGEKMSSVGKKMVAGGGVIGKIAGAGLVAAGATTKVAGKAAKAAGTVTKAVGKGTETVAKKAHQAVQQNKKK